MRIKFFVLSVVVLAIGLWLLLHGSTSKHALTVSPEPKMAGNSPGVPVQANPIVKRQNSFTNTPIATNSAPPSVMDARRKAILGQIENQWRTPIEFYGKVIDEKTNAIAGAQVDFACNDLSKSGTSYYHAQSDANGSFSIEGIQGKLLKVNVSKQGNYSYSPNGNYFYFAGQNQNFVPDSQNPVVFRLRKKGNDAPLVALKRNYRIPRDGTPIAIDLSSGVSTTSNIGDFVVQCRTLDTGKRPGEKYDWDCIVTVPNGGIVPTHEEFPFLAPDDGYVASTEISMPTDSTHWQSEETLQFYYRLANGCYGRMTFSMIAGGHHFCMINSAFNPTGSRELEP